MKKVDRCLKSHFISERLSQFDRLVKVIEAFTAMPLENRIWPLVRGKRLILLTDDPHFATQARFIQQPLCKHINTQLQLKLGRVDIKVMNIPLTRAMQPIERKKISSQTATVVSSIAESIDDPELQTALRRLVRSD